MAYVAVSGSPKCPPWMEEEGCAEPDKRFDGIAEVDLRAQVRTRMLPGGSDPESFDITPDGARIVVSNEDTDEASLVDLESGEIFRTVPVGAEPEGVRISPDGTLAYVTGETDHDVTVLDTSTGDEITRITVGHRPRDLVFTPDGTYAYVSAEIAGNVSEIVVAENRVSRTIALPEGSRSMGVALSPDAGTLYVANGRSKTVSVIDLASGEVTANVEVGERPWGLALSFDGSRLYTANGPSNDVTVLDTETLEIVARIEVGAGNTDGKANAKRLETPRLVAARRATGGQDTGRRAVQPVGGERIGPPVVEGSPARPWSPGLAPGEDAPSEPFVTA